MGASGETQPPRQRGHSQPLHLLGRVGGQAQGPPDTRPPPRHAREGRGSHKRGDSRRQGSWGAWTLPSTLHTTETPKNGSQAFQDDRKGETHTHPSFHVLGPTHRQTDKSEAKEIHGRGGQRRWGEPRAGGGSPFLQVGWAAGLGGRTLTRCRQQGRGPHRRSPGGQGTCRTHSAPAETDLGFGDELLHTTPKAQSMKEIPHQLDSTETKDSRSAQDDGRKRERKPQTGRKHLQNTHLLKDGCPNIQRTLKTQQKENNPITVGERP